MLRLDTIGGRYRGVSIVRIIISCHYHLDIALSQLRFFSKLFSKEELEELIPIAEKLWIESEGELPDYYVSPLK